MRKKYDEIVRRMRKKGDIYPFTLVPKPNNPTVVYLAQTNRGDYLVVHKDGVRKLKHLLKKLNEKRKKRH